MNELKHGAREGGGAVLGVSQWAKEIFHEGNSSLQDNCDLRSCPSSRGQSGSEPVTGTELGMWDSGKKASFGVSWLGCCPVW